MITATRGSIFHRVRRDLRATVSRYLHVCLYALDMYTGAVEDETEIFLVQVRVHVVLDPNTVMPCIRVGPFSFGCLFSWYLRFVLLRLRRINKGIPRPAFHALQDTSQYAECWELTGMKVRTGAGVDKTIVEITTSDGMPSETCGRKHQDSWPAHIDI